MTGEPDDVPALTAIAIPGLPQPRYRAYPLLDHIADKTCAILERQGTAQRPSTRFKDLVDLVTLVAHAKPTADAQHRALASEAERRGLTLPQHFEVPDESLWEPGYAAEARRAFLPAARTLSDALAEVRPFLARCSTAQPKVFGPQSATGGAARTSSRAAVRGHLPGRRDS